MNRTFSDVSPYTAPINQNFMTHKAEEQHGAQF